MALETATYISQLVAANPLIGDPTGQGDNHLRLIKAVLQAQFPAFTAAALASSNVQLDAAVAAVGSSGTLALSVGSAAAPTYAFTGDTGTGIYRAGASQVAVSLAGTQQLLLSSTALTVPNASLALTAGSISAGGSCSITGAYSGGTGQLVPTGSTHVWWTATVPTGYLFANGAAVSRTTYAALYALFGTTFGAGDGVTTFNLPDMREAAPVGSSTMGGTTTPGRITNYVATTIGGFIGACLHLLTTGEMPSHTHTATSVVTDPGHSHVNSGAPAGNYSGGGGGQFFQGENYPSTQGYTGSTAATSVTVATTNASIGGAGSHDNTSSSVVCNWIIKT